MLCRRTLIPLVVAGALLLLTGCASTTELQDRRGQAARVNVELGQHYLRRGELRHAKENLDRALEQDPDSPQVQAAQAMLQERLGRIDRADGHYRRALSLASSEDAGMLWNNYGTFLCRQGRLEEAEEAFARAARDPLYPTPEMAWTNAGICALKVPDEEKAERLFRRALKEDPQHVPALLEMLRLSAEAGHHLQVRAYFQRLREQTRPTAEMLWLCHQAELALGNRDEAGRCALGLKNDFPDSEETARLRKLENRGNR
ncbi:type IV pilus biogenesis/stability protein PilW [Ectothiorhodospira mobilis]|jgi:type IV pilus assembly protein PilF|uniref:type IV pilus biogenesis/stability protein PilW n=1 Tax=Ectothiorhodospira mobilis TaxID=195064 RepID=UPI001EE80DC7|nr:type IV pilus biogenesis/stability protein PilW [Ectothiorhodospira mobilis]MCG5535678.1 type IV pilus biogenesis/stability protein PilW [Ectothiorhodospira mobilis]